jgi:catechol 2,3-dioxygenase-like lactoylglutathione lyase family enzyme
VAADPLASNCLDIVPELPVADLLAAETWFHDLLGFQTVWVWEDSFAAVGCGEVQVYLRKTEGPRENVRCYLHVKDADRLYERCKQYGGAIVDEIESKPWGMREFAVTSPDGHILRIGHGEKRVDEIFQFKPGDQA